MFTLGAQNVPPTNGTVVALASSPIAVPTAASNDRLNDPAIPIGAGNDVVGFFAPKKLGLESGCLIYLECFGGLLEASLQLSSPCTTKHQNNC